MEETYFLKTFLEIGVAGGIAFYLLTKTTDAIKDLCNSSKELATKFDVLNARLASFESELKDIKFKLEELRAEKKS